ncbi:YecA family protein, partial [Rhodobacter capsulatus]
MHLRSTGVSVRWRPGLKSAILTTAAPARRSWHCARFGFDEVEGRTMEWHSDEDLRKLEEALMALPEENDPMLLPEFDGFCAGLITSPEMIPPSVWLAKVWGEGGAPEFESLADMQATLDLLMAHYNRVATALMMPGEYFPVMDEDQRNGDILWEFWMLGFLAAMQLRPEAWGKIAASRNVRAIKALKK